MNRYHLYEWLAPDAAHRAYLRHAYDASRQLAQTQPRPFPANASPQILLCGVGRTATAEFFCDRVRKFFPAAEITLLDQRRDVLEKSLHKIRRHSPAQNIQLTTGDALALPFADAAFDWIETDHFLQFFRADQLPRLFAEWQRVLRPGGCVTTRHFTPDKNRAGDRVPTVIWKTICWIVSAPCHIHPAAEIQTLLAQNNFTVHTAPFPVRPRHRITSIIALKKP
jgi:ubiquinone/menaquinone biosynthesis C-methylase UbiE